MHAAMRICSLADRPINELEIVAGQLPGGMPVAERERRTSTPNSVERKVERTPGSERKKRGSGNLIAIFTSSADTSQ